MTFCREKWTAWPWYMLLSLLTVWSILLLYYGGETKGHSIFHVICGVGWFLLVLIDSQKNWKKIRFCEEGIRYRSFFLPRTVPYEKLDGLAVVPYSIQTKYGLMQEELFSCLRLRDKKLVVEKRRLYHIGLLKKSETEAIVRSGDLGNIWLLKLNQGRRCFFYMRCKPCELAAIAERCDCRIWTPVKLFPYVLEEWANEQRKKIQTFRTTDDVVEWKIVANRID